MIRIIILLLFIALAGEVKAQWRHESTIANELHRIDVIFDDQPFIDKSVGTGYTGAFTDYVEILSIDTIQLHLNKSCLSSFVNYVGSHYLYRIKVSGSKMANYTNLPYGSLNELKRDTLTFYTIGTFYGYYRLFGFYTSDINQLFEEERTNNVKLMKCLGNELVNKGVLNKKQAKLFYQVFKQEQLTYPTNMQMPASIMKYYFPKDEINKANTIILPKAPFRPIAVEDLSPIHTK